jgi:hypothetical protein
MKKYKVFNLNDPQEEKIFYVEAKSLDEAMNLACKIKNLEPSKFFLIYKIKPIKYESYV